MNVVLGASDLECDKLPREVTTQRRTNEPSNVDRLAQELATVSPLTTTKLGPPVPESERDGFSAASFTRCARTTRVSDDPRIAARGL